MYQAECKSYIDNFLTYNMMTIIPKKKKKSHNRKFGIESSLRTEVYKQRIKQSANPKRFKEKQFAKFWMIFVFVS